MLIDRYSAASGIRRIIRLPRDPRRVLDSALNHLCNRHLPSKHRFFSTLTDLSPDVEKLGELYLNYQAAMHATRVMVYHLPHLNQPSLRRAKLQIYIDDDGLENGDTHHYQLARVFRNLGAKPPLSDEDFGDLEELKLRVSSGTSTFISAVERLYPRSLGAWAIVEMLSNDWMHALAWGLSAHFQKVLQEPYFKDCFDLGVENRHGIQALALAQNAVARKPETLPATIADATAMAIQLDRFWTELEKILLGKTPLPLVPPPPGRIRARRSKESRKARPHRRA